MMLCIDTVPGLSLDDVRAFYRAHWTCDNVVIGIGGSYDGEVLQRLQRDLQEMPQGKAPSVGLSQPRRSSAMTMTIVQKAAPATAMRMGFPIAVHRGSREWYALALANSWFGDHRHTSSHLFQVIREARGLNYGDYSYIENFPNGGQRFVPPQNVARRQQIFELWIRPVPNDARLFALRAALREFQQLLARGLTAGRPAKPMKPSGGVPGPRSRSLQPGRDCI